MTSLAELGEVSKAQHEQDSHMGRYLAGTGIGMIGAGEIAERAGHRRVDRAWQGLEHGFEQKGLKAGKRLRRVGGNLKGWGGPVVVLGAGAGLANIAHKRRTQHVGKAKDDDDKRGLQNWAGGGAAAGLGAYYGGPKLERAGSKKAVRALMADTPLPYADFNNIKGVKRKYHEWTGKKLPGARRIIGGRVAHAAAIPLAAGGLLLGLNDYVKRVSED